MSSSVLLFLAFILSLYGLSYLSRLSTLELFKVLLKYFKNQKIAYWLISIIYLPGTLLHESAHAISATFLLLNVRGFSIWPKYEDGGLRLGYVLYEKKDVFRSILVGVSPIFFGIFIFLFVSYLKPFSNGVNLYSLAFLYIIFVVSSTMFSSKQDLKDLIFIYPILIILGILIYIFPSQANYIGNYIFLTLDNIYVYLYDLLWYVVLSIFIQIIVFIFSKILLITTLKYGKR